MLQKYDNKKMIFPTLFGELFQEIDSKFFSPMYNQMPKYPPMDIYTNKNGEHVVEIATTFKPENIDINVQDSYITISGKNEETKEENNDIEKYHHRTISKKSFSQTLNVNYQIDKESIQATMENGLLKVIFKEKKSDPIKIEVKS